MEEIFLKKKKLHNQNMARIILEYVILKHVPGYLFIFNINKQNIKVYQKKMRIGIF